MCCCAVVAALLSLVAAGFLGLLLVSLWPVSPLVRVSSSLLWWPCVLRCGNRILRRFGAQAAPERGVSRCIEWHVSAYRALDSSWIQGETTALASRALQLQPR